ncbi:hypothetical protein AXK33_25515 [Escherichia coli]|nr:hypothetical protein AXK33_25515 [Escherichia coli]
MPGSGWQLDRREGGTEMSAAYKVGDQLHWKFPAEQFASDQYHALFQPLASCRSGIRGERMMVSDKRLR